MTEETHLKIIVAGLITAAAVNNDVAHGFAQKQAIRATEEIFNYFTKPQKK